MGLKYLVKLLRRFRVVILVILTFVVPVRAHCDSYGLRNDDDHNVGDWRDDDGGDWQLYTFKGTTECLICFFGMPNENEGELVFPCWDQNHQRIRRITVSYIFCRPGNGAIGMPLCSKSSDTTCENTVSNNEFLKKESTQSMDNDRCRTRNIQIEVEQNVSSYHLKASGINRNSFVCLKDVKYLIDHTTTTTSIHSSPKGNQNTALEQKQSKSPIWVIFVIIAIVIISICAVAVFIRRRKQHDHQPANNVNTGRVNDKSNGIKDNMKNDKDVIANPTYGQETVNEKDEEYHSYTEIDVKIPDNSEMIYNSAYESQPAGSEMVYNSAYESPPATSDMVYNSAYESSPSS